MAVKTQRMCERCGQPIDPQRVEVLPETGCCVGCSCERCRDASSVDLAEADDEEQGKAVQQVQH